MRSRLLIPACCLGLLVACTAKEREQNLANGGSAGQSEGGSAGVSGSGADGGMGGTAAEGGSAGTTGGGGSTAGTGAGGAGGTGAAGAGGTGGSGGTTLKCTIGAATELTVDTTLPPMDNEPQMAVTRCGEDGFLARETTEGVDIFRIRFGSDGDPIDQKWSYRAQGASVNGLSCDANNLRLLTRGPNGVGEWLFPLQGRDLQTPLNPSTAPITIPSECINTSTILPSYNGGLHWMLECHPTASQTKLVAGSPIIDFISGPAGEELQLAAYAYSGGLHVGMNEQGQGWAGATVAQLGVTQQLAFEDPTQRPTALATITSNNAGFFVVGITVNQPPSLLPGKLFTGPVVPSKINDIFVGGSLPSTVKERRMITSTDEIGPTSQLMPGMNTVVFSTINLSNQVLFNIMRLDGEILTWAQLIHDPTNGATIRRTYALPNNAGNGNFVAWAEYDANNKYRAYVRSMICL